ncbi:GNAT family N-acetyltransferase [Coraliomargarita parva]|uniref:GNAT family N-acetyltransferase n=1 Tax=Coraliomargarita parva TaxID=3014050 RepID=UPI0022B503ED|nr:GNAT family N-acetyltransferase [Coraliomargarita parva]
MPKKEHAESGLRIGPAELEDVDRIAALLGLLFQQEADFQPDPESQRAGIQALLAAPEMGEFLLLRDPKGNVLGLLSLLYSISTALGGRVATLEDFIISPEYRGRGWGHRLLDAALELARTRQCKRITLLTDADNHAAQKLYHAYGFKRSAMCVMRRLDGPEGQSASSAG